MSHRIHAKAIHHYSVPAVRVYDAWLDPSAVYIWMSSALKSHGLSGEMKRVEIDPVVGGKFCFSDMRNGSEAIHRGEYRILDRPLKIAITWVVGDSDDDEPSVVTITMTPASDGCEVTIIHEMDAQWIDYVERTAAGWTRMLTHINELLSRGNTS
ncbi:SRPBCC family protein [Lacunimicrobium album]